MSSVNTGVSIMAEAILGHLAQQHVHAASAGESTSWGDVHPLALECLRAHGVATKGLHSKRWGEFFGLDKSPVRILIALDEVYAARASWPASTLVAHWPMSDPAALAAPEVDIRVAFEAAYELLRARIEKLLSLQWERMSDQALSEALARIGGR